MPAPTVVFDLDGTLVDTAPDLIDTLNVILAPEGVRPVRYDTARLLVGGGARLMIERAFAAQDMMVDPTNLNRLFDRFIAHYAEHVADKSQPFAGVAAAMDALAGSGARFAVCTNKLEGLARLLLDRLELTPRFAFICGQETFGVPKPDPIPLLRTIARAGGDPRSAVMVGDSATDVRTARAAGIPVIAVDFGYSDVPAHELGADRIISHFAELPPAVADMLRRG